ncbi:hypothetical protein [Dulcicalothrix desertica]|uniref:hypothetical protein n=1 Tax=Dulcicalothrix desertica TaxID=32056 RepID=UPI000F8DB59D|nr:hypothetical protein [Dulcicalothrix desertica]
MYLNVLLIIALSNCEQWQSQPSAPMRRSVYFTSNCNECGYGLEQREFYLRHQRFKVFKLHS